MPLYSSQGSLPEDVLVLLTASPEMEPMKIAARVIFVSNPGMGNNTMEFFWDHINEALLPVVLLDK